MRSMSYNVQEWSKNCVTITHPCFHMTHHHSVRIVSHRNDPNGEFRCVSEETAFCFRKWVNGKVKKTDATAQDLVFRKHDDT